MTSKSKKPRPERDLTDRSLRVERQKTDDELAKQRRSTEEDADAVVRRARDRADQVLQRARDRADENVDRSDTPERVRGSVSRERAQEDEALQRERAVADDQLLNEREERKRALASLLAIERELTDEHLRIERARLDEAVTSRDDFLGMVSHDLRTLLGGIAMNASMLVMSASNDDAGNKIRRLAESIQRFTARMNRLVGDLLDVVSIEAGKLGVSPRQDDVIRLLRDASEAFQPIASAKGLSLEVEVAKDSLLAKFDYERILQVLANLLSNAIKFTPEGGRVSVRVEPRGTEVLFSVTDTGPGIPREKQAAIFDRFWQADVKDRRGLGLGLYISRCIVEAHGGRIGVKSKPGEGSTFSFTLPAARNRAKRQRE